MAVTGDVEVLVSFVDYVFALLHSVLSSYVNDFLHRIVQCPPLTLSTKLQEPEPQPHHQQPTENYR